MHLQVTIKPIAGVTSVPVVFSFRLFLGPVFAPPWLNLKLTKIKAMLFLQCHCCMLTNQKIKRIWKKMLDDIKMTNVCTYL